VRGKVKTEKINKEKERDRLCKKTGKSIKVRKHIGRYWYLIALTPYHSRPEGGV
jgi:hypothetical protein